MPKPRDREWIARLIRTQRLKASGAGAFFVISSPDAPAEEADLETADLILASLNAERARATTCT